MGHAHHRQQGALHEYIRQMSALMQAMPAHRRKDVDLGGGSLGTAGNAWEALLAHWLRTSVGVCGVRRLQQFLERAQWICRPL